MWIILSALPTANDVYGKKNETAQSKSAKVREEEKGEQIKCWNIRSETESTSDAFHSVPPIATEKCQAICVVEMKARIQFHSGKNK